MIEHSDAVYRLALSIVGFGARRRRRPRHLGKGVARVAYVPGGASLRSWVLRIAHNTAISTLRTRRATLMDPAEMPEREVVPERSVERRVESGEVMDAFVVALDHLDELSRSIVVLRELEGWPTRRSQRFLGCHYRRSRLDCCGPDETSALY
ncbi:MAG: hypothetical protein R2706_04705 [Acidimicrobiales bacterium]